jgi:hypothetical protein
MKRMHEKGVTPDKLTNRASFIFEQDFDGGPPPCRYPVGSLGNWRTRIDATECTATQLVVMIESLTRKNIRSGVHFNSLRDLAELVGAQLVLWIPEGFLSTQCSNRALHNAVDEVQRSCGYTASDETGQAMVSLSNGGAGGKHGQTVHFEDLALIIPGQEGHTASHLIFARERVDFSHMTGTRGDRSSTVGMVCRGQNEGETPVKKQKISDNTARSAIVALDQKKSDSTANARSHDFMFRLLDTGNKTTIPYYTDQNGGVALALNGTRCCGTRAKKQAHKVDYEMILKEAATTNPEALHRLYCATIQILSVAVPERTGSPQGRNTTAAVRTNSEGSRGDHDRAGYTQRRKLKAQPLNEGGKQDPDGLVGSTRVEKHTVHTLRDGGRMELDAEELFRQEGYLRAFGCVTAKWSRRRIQQFQDSTSSAAIEQARLLIHWNQWRVRYVKIAVMFDTIGIDKALRKAMRKRCTMRKVRQRMVDYAASKAAGAVSTEHSCISP